MGRAREGQEDPACPADRHLHSRRGYRRGCICPSTIAAYEQRRQYLADLYAAQSEAKKAARRQRHARQRREAEEQALLESVMQALTGREIDDCPADVHRHSVRGWYRDGCRCPSTVKVYEAWLEAKRAWHRDHPKPRLTKGAGQTVAVFDLRRASRLDAEAIAQGYRIARMDTHTRALAVKLMLQARPTMTDRQIAWRLDTAGQGRTVTKADGTREYQAVAVRQVQRIIAGLLLRQPDLRPAATDGMDPAA